MSDKKCTHEEWDGEPSLIDLPNDELQCLKCNKMWITKGDNENEITKGIKDSQTINKPAMEFLVGEFLLEMGKILKYGADQYGAENWKNYPLSAKDYKGARLRHAFQEGNDNDTGCSHLAHEAINCMFQWWHERNESLK